MVISAMEETESMERDEFQVATFKQGSERRHLQDHM